MTQSPARRLTAAVALAATLTLFALPAAASPGTWSFGTWEVPTLLAWFDAAWTGWLGTPAAAPGDGGANDFTAISGKANAASEPEGISRLSTDTSPDDSGFVPSPTGGSW